MITKIIRQYKGFANYWYPDVELEKVYLLPREELEKLREGCDEKERYLLKKYEKYIPPGWYGFSLGSPTPYEWYEIIEKFLDYLIGLQEKGKISNFEIHQIKTKFGGLRFYVGYTCEDEEFDEFIELQTSHLERHLSDEKLVY